MIRAIWNLYLITSIPFWLVVFAPMLLVNIGLYYWFKPKKETPQVVVYVHGDKVGKE